MFHVHTPDALARWIDAEPVSLPLLDGHPVYATFDIEHGTDAGYGLKRDRRDLVSGFAFAHVADDVGQFKALAPRMAPAERAEQPILAEIDWQAVQREE